MLKTKPKNWREGQTIGNFLRWMNQEFGGENIYLADPFYITDKDLNKLYKEFLKSINTHSKIK